MGMISYNLGLAANASMSYRCVKRSDKFHEVTAIFGYKAFNPDVEEMQALAEINVHDKDILFTKKIIINSNHVHDQRAKV